jgi:hypothetical protein
MLWAITPNGTGNPVGIRAVQPGWPLLAGETFAVPGDVEIYTAPDIGLPVALMVLADDGLSLRPVRKIK